MKLKSFIHPLFLIALGLLIFSFFDQWLLMPDHLSKAHAKLESSCSSCHPGFKGVPRKSCLSCKKQMGLNLEQGIHHYAPIKKCSTCHQEHLGKNYPLATAWLNPKSFDHNWTGFDLAPYHLDLACDKCHEAHKPYKDVKKTCKSCHTNFTPKLFNHAKVGCALSYPHNKYACDKCHTKGFGPNTKPSCVACHQDTYKLRQVCKKPVN